MSTQTKQIRATGTWNFGIDTTFVLFFLAFDLGQSLLSMELAVVASVITLAMLLVLPYFLPSLAERPDFANWLIVRMLVASGAIVLGILYGGLQGATLPGYAKSLPMTLFIISAMISCYIQFCGLIKTQLAK